MSKLVKKRINNVLVKEVPVQKAKDTRPILGADLFPKLSANIFFCAKKGSGKTSGIYQTIKSCANKETKIVAFVGSLYNDKSWITIQKYCEDKGIEFEGHTSIFDEDGDNILEAFVNRLKQLKEGKDEGDAEEDSDSEGEQTGFGAPGGITVHGEIKIISTGKIKGSPSKKQKKRRSKFQSPAYMVILDDVSLELRNKSVTALLKIHRHWPSKILISSQQCNDLALGGRNQIDYTLIYGGMPKDKVETIWKNCALPITFDQLWTMYREATEKKFDFLYIDAPENKYRINFNTELEIPME